ncbi:tyrosine-type recombinase/integrase [Beggiatoa leptomitoformis]|uniref:Tyrosine-type recombinase/integrase n=1 Tax=Beggiatoa leptomitoformis TaxID=288004 RepID=A0A2N9YCV2_9GAMM|nr:tyrosine-type recombinase/integrase [Beggiatoa leptomitoformis]ALG66455.1 tyrosine-type recombinase/integrase [Beggiatoa leptomitoformis]AUI68264.1 tyrosine-type recombinase/integrase [Beggiatoa leptomitoformis]
MRKQALLTLSWTQFNRDTQSLRLHKTKSGKPRTVPLNQIALSELQRCRNGRFVFQIEGRAIRDIKHSFASVCRLAGIVDCTPHTLRRTFFVVLFYYIEYLVVLGFSAGREKQCK